MELYDGPEAGIDYGLHGLPESLQEANPPGVYVTYGDTDQDGPTQFPHDLPGATHALDYLHHLNSPYRFWVGVHYLSRIGLVEPHLEVLHTEVSVTACLVGA